MARGMQPKMRHLMYINFCYMNLFTYESAKIPFHPVTEQHPSISRIGARTGSSVASLFKVLKIFGNVINEFRL